MRPHNRGVFFFHIIIPYSSLFNGICLQCHKTIKLLNQKTSIMKKLKFFFLFGALALTTFSACEKVLCGIEDTGTTDTGGGDCTVNYTKDNFKVTHDYGDGTGVRYLDLETGTATTSETSATDVIFQASDNSRGFFATNGTKLKSVGLTGADWADLCDSDLSPATHGEPSSDSQGFSTSGTAANLIFFKTGSGKYGLIWIEHEYDYRTSDNWQVDKGHIAIQ